MIKTRYKKEINYSLLKNSKLKFHKNSKKKPIYHYTSISGLDGIIGNKKLHFTNIKYMNDKDEINAGLDSIAKMCNLPAKDIYKINSSFINCGMQTFVSCFSLDKDSLPMWNYYTKEINNQGYNIEFDDKKLVESILCDNPFLEGSYMSFGVVDYSKDNDSEYTKDIINEMLSSRLHNSTSNNPFLASEKMKLFDDVLFQNEEVIHNIKKSINYEEKKNKLSDLPIYFYNGEKCIFEKDFSGDHLYFIKRNFFEQEHEYRIVITVLDERLIELKEKGIYKFRLGKGILIPFLELNFSKDVVKSITISPTVQSDLVELSLQDYLKYNGFEIDDYSTFIQHSSIPVRF